MRPNLVVPELKLGEANTLNGQTYSYTYNHANRRQSVTDGAQNPTTLATYLYNAFGERVVKSTGGTTQHAHYMDGLRLSETDQSGNAITEYIYLAGTPIAVIKNANQAIPADEKLYYIVPDHLATPRVVLDQDQQIVWRQNATPFGIVDIDEDPDGDAQVFTLDARFPGQYWDQETQSSYNYFRDYDETLGRYLQSDPIGLSGGVNTYAYVGGNPIYFSDPLGLCPCGKPGSNFSTASANIHGSHMNPTDACVTTARNAYRNLFSNNNIGAGKPFTSPPHHTTHQNLMNQMQNLGLAGPLMQFTFNGSKWTHVQNVTTLTQNVGQVIQSAGPGIYSVGVANGVHVQTLIYNGITFDLYDQGTRWGGSFITNKAFNAHLISMTQQLNPTYAKNGWSAVLNIHQLCLCAIP